LSSTSQPPSGLTRTKTSGTIGCTTAEPYGAPRLGIELADFGDHVGEIRVIDAAQAAQRRKIAPRHQIEMHNERLHRGVEAVLLP
jgi:hypothetical protein